MQRRRFVAASRVIKQKLTNPAQLSALVTGNTKVALEVNPLDGAVADIGATQTAFPHRGDFGDVQVYLPADPNVTRDAAKQAVDQVQTQLATIATGGAYVNYINDDREDWESAYYGGNLPALRTIARKYDPAGVLAFKQGLVPTSSGVTGNEAAPVRCGLFMWTAPHQLGTTRLVFYYAP